MQMLLIFSLIAIVAFVLERLLPARSLSIFRRGFVADALYVVINILIRIVFTNALAIEMTALGQRFLPENVVGLVADYPFWVQAVSIIFLLDFFAYWMHRGKHRYNWWWRLHETHHSSVDLDWFSSVRFHPLEKILDRVIYLVPLMFLGASEEALLALAATDALVASISHANTRLKYGPLNYLIVSPELHRIHHSAEPRHMDRNFGNNFSIFDWIFGTAYLQDEQPTEFGLADDNFDHENIVNQIMYAFRKTNTS